MTEKKLIKVAFVFAHPDDEHIPFGLPAQLAEYGDQVHLIALTRGDLGSHSIVSRRQIAVIRKREFEDSATILGAQKEYILGFPDGKLMSNSQKAKLHLLKLLRQIDPDVVILPPDDYHEDHRTTGEVAKWATFHLKDAPLVVRKGLLRRRVKPTAKDVAVYEMDTQGSQTWLSTQKDTGENAEHLNPVNMILSIGGKAIARSVEAFQAHNSQVEIVHDGGLNYVALAQKGARRRGQQAGFTYGVGLNFIPFGGYAFSTINLLAQKFGPMQSKIIS